MHSNANSNHSKGIRSIRIQIWTIRKGLKAFDSKFKPFEWDSKLSKGIRGIRMQIQTIRKRFEAFECKIELFERDSMVSK